MVRFGIVGANGIARKFARDIVLTKNATLTAVSARTLEKANKYKEEYQVPFAYSSYLELAESKEIDAVYIATPHCFHYEQAILFMNHKKHVLVEKPIAVNQKQLNEMIKIAKKNNVLLMEAMWTHFLPSSQFIKKIIKSKTPGKLLEAHIDFGYSLINDYPDEKRLMNINLAGGSILDLGIYPISFYHFIKQVPIKSVSAKAEFTHTGVDASCDIDITDENDAHIYIRSSMNEKLPNHAKLIFENGSIELKDFSRSSQVYINDSKFDISFEGEGFVHEIRSFSESIMNKDIENSIMTHQASLSCLETMDKVRNIIELKYPFE
ncbi:Gfo/Idh/MocA family oxidoreductase [Mycoplasmatota bacterium WC30]